MSRDKSWWQGLESVLRARARTDSERLNGSLGPIESGTVPLYFPKNLKGAPELIATGVLLSIGECVFLLTAAHAIEHFSHYPVLLPIDGRFVPAFGESYRTKLPRSGTHADDPLDAAVLRIDGKEREALRPRCLTLGDVHVIDRAYDIGFYVAGYPRKRFRREGRVLIHNPGTIVLTGQPTQMYEKLGLSPTEHIVMEFGKLVIGPKGFARTPAMRGMSGGGVWIVPALATSALPPKLTGIFIEARKKASVAIGTSIAVHLSLIANYHPELVDSIKNARANQDFEAWLLQTGNRGRLPKEMVPPEFRSLLGGWLK